LRRKHRRKIPFHPPNLSATETRINFFQPFLQFLEGTTGDEKLHGFQPELRLGIRLRLDEVSPLGVKWAQPPTAREMVASAIPTCPVGSRRPMIVYVIKPLETNFGQNMDFAGLKMFVRDIASFLLP
jgi:hypothetical protein